MNYFLIVGNLLEFTIMASLSLLGWQLLRQNGRILLRLEDLERRLDEFELGEGDGGAESAPPAAQSSSGNGDRHEDRFRKRDLARSKIKRDGLKAGTPAPGFRLPRLDGLGDLSLKDFRGRRVLLVFSSPHCGPCNILAPHLEKFHRTQQEIRIPGQRVQVVLISRGEPKENRAKLREHGLTFPIIMQQQWEISRQYAMFGTPSAYLIDEQGIITRDVTVGSDAILELLDQPGALFNEAHEVVPAA